MKLLRNFTKFGEYLDIETGKIICSESVLPDLGFYCTINEQTCQLYVENKKLYLKWGSDIYLIDNYSKAKTSVIKQINDNMGLKKFQLFQNKYFFKKKLVVEFEYIMEFGYSFMNPFDSISEPDEDWDLGLFISNIINDKVYKNNFIKVRSLDSF